MATDSASSGTRVSIVVPGWRAMATLPRVLDRLAAEAAADAEVVVVESTADGSADLLRAGWPWAMIVAAPARLSPGRARNIGVNASSGGIVVFLDADAVPEPRWLARLVAPLAAGADAVAGSVANGTPGSAIGTASWLLEFSELLPGRRHRVGHGASCNLAVTRAALQKFGGFPEGMFPGEDTVLTTRLAANGRLIFEPGAVVRHHNRTSLAQFIRHQFRLGQSFAAVCQAVPFEHGSFAHPALAPLAWLLKGAALARRLAPRPRDALTAVVLSPLLVTGIAVWTAGVVVAAWSRPEPAAGSGRDTEAARP